MNTTYRYEFVLRGCSGREQIVLPRQTPLGISAGQQYLPTPMWPAVFWCPQHALLFSHSAETDLPQSDEVQVLDPNAPHAVLWEVAFERDHKNCGRHHTIWLAQTTDDMRDGLSASETELGKLLSGTPTAVPCGSHQILLREQKVRLTKYPK